MELIKKIKKKSETVEEVERLYEEFFKVFDINTYIGYLSEDNPKWRSYTDKRGCWGTYSLNRPNYESQKVAEENVKRYIKDLVNLRREGKAQCSDIEILSLAAILEEIDQRFAYGLLFYPTPVTQVEDGIFKESSNGLLARVVNSLVKYDNNIDPYGIESRIKSLYYQDTIRYLSKSWRYTVHVRKLIGESKK